MTALADQTKPLPPSGAAGGEFTWSRPHLLGLETLSAQEIVAILDTARALTEVSTRSVKKVPALRGRDRGEPLF